MENLDNGINLIGKEVEFWVRRKKAFKTKGIVKEYFPRPKHKVRGKGTLMKSTYLIVCNGVYKYKMTRSEFNVLT